MATTAADRAKIVSEFQTAPKVVSYTHLDVYKRHGY